jgi:hypothetical protein
LTVEEKQEPPENRRGLSLFWLARVADGYYDGLGPGNNLDQGQ